MQENDITVNMPISTKNQILVQMLQYQKKGLPYKQRLDLDDIKRIVDNIETSPFADECCIWNGYVTNNNDKCKYINFYFKHRKIALHRLMYINYNGPLDDKNYLKFTCLNKGVCCNIKHIEKCNITPTTYKENAMVKTANTKNQGLQVIRMDASTEKNKLIVVFD